MTTRAEPTSRARRFFLWTALVLSAVVIIPPIVSAVSPAESRQLEAVELNEMEYAEVRFPNRLQDLELAGMLFTPSGQGPFPGAVVIHGSGTSRRDNGWYLTVADHLRNQSIAVLLPDKRGSERSEGDWRTASFEDLATDTEAAVSFLASREEIRSVGVIGMSQGGRIAPIVASRSSTVSWVVNIVGDAVTAHQALRYEESRNLREMGFLPVVSDLLAYPSAWSLIHVRDSAFWDAVGDFDPIPYWGSVDQPSLVIYGEEDTNVPTKASVERLVALAKTNMEISVYEGSGHAIEDPEGQGNSIFRGDALDELTAFIDENA